MSQYYYLMAQMPSLTPDAPAPLSPAAFRELCADKLSPADLAVLDACRLRPDRDSAATGSRLLDGWNLREAGLVRALARQRAARLGRPAVPEAAAAADPELEALARRALEAGDPLEGELVLDQARWTAIESLRDFQAFDRDTVIAYMLHLLLLERRGRFDTETGTAAYRAAYRRVLDDYETRRNAGESA